MTKYTAFQITYSLDGLNNQVIWIQANTSESALAQLDKVLGTEPDVVSILKKDTYRFEDEGALRLEVDRINSLRASGLFQDLKDLLPIVVQQRQASSTGYGILEVIDGKRRAGTGGMTATHHFEAVFG